LKVWLVIVVAGLGSFLPGLIGLLVTEVPYEVGLLISNFAPARDFPLFIKGDLISNLS
jgi:hypothetical protein